MPSSPNLPKLPYEQQPVAMVGYRATRGLTQFISRVTGQFAARCAASSGDTGDLMAVRPMRSPTT